MSRQRRFEWQGNEGQGNVFIPLPNIPLPQLSAPIFLPTLSLNPQLSTLQLLYNRARPGENPPERLA
jgi:hypothetical protein